MDCICHYNHRTNVTETLSLVSNEEEELRLITCAQDWVSINKEPECTIAKKLLETGVTSNSTCYHRQCFLRFASKSKLEAAQRVKRVSYYFISIKFYFIIFISFLYLIFNIINHTQFQTLAGCIGMYN